MATTHGHTARSLAWTAAGATVGSLVREGVDQIWPGHLIAKMLLAGIAAGLIGFAFVTSTRAVTTRTLLMAAGGAAGSLSIVAAHAASTRPGQSLLCLLAFFASAIGCLLLGLLAGRPVGAVAGDAQPEDRS